nr:muscarinic acetylcholine receptor M4-like [Lytechinus pictus]
MEDSTTMLRLTEQQFFSSFGSTENNTNSSEATTDRPVDGLLVTIVLIGSGCIGVFLVVSFNALHLLALRSAKMFPTNLRLCLRVLGVIDLLGGFICYGKVVLVAVDNSFYSDVTKCTISNGVMFIFVGMSHMILMLITIDRYIAVTRPLRYHALLNRRRMKLLIITALFGGAVVGEVPTFHLMLSGTCHPEGEELVKVKQSFVAVYTIIPFAFVMVTTVLNLHLLLISKSHEDRHKSTSPTCPPEQTGGQLKSECDEEELEELRNRSTSDSSRPNCCMKMNKGTVTISIVVGTSYLNEKD